ncbi:MAG: hypothetical protein DRH11_09485 [Deltaproteobacteria bacterium]|nr:MAG: hypothetical protein DRH11_09485 [Deltaproteobacteria bacterium]
MAYILNARSFRELRGIFEDAPKERELSAVLKRHGSRYDSGRLGAVESLSRKDHGPPRCAWLGYLEHRRPVLSLKQKGKRRPGDAPKYEYTIFPKNVAAE